MYRRLLTWNPHIFNVHVPVHVFGALGLGYGLAHLGWPLVLSFLAFNFWFSGLGMSIGFHRYFTHRAFTTNRFWQRVMLIGGTLAGQGSVLFWVALHRQHHATSDTVKDIHSPRYGGFWHAYCGWIFSFDPTKFSLSRASDLLRDPWCRFTHRHYTKIMWAWWFTLLLVYVVAPVLRPVVAGALIAGVWAIQQEALVNSVCHDPRFGTAGFDTGDRSRNISGIVSLCTWGQTLHHNHHATPRNPDFGDETSWDSGYAVIRGISTNPTIV